MVQKCLDCLRGAVSGQLDNLYTAALLSYTFTLAGDQETRSKLITYLHQKSSSKGKLGRGPAPPAGRALRFTGGSLCDSAAGSTRHWDRAGAAETGLDSLEVEMTSYVLLALLSGPTLPGFGLDYSSGIVRWLVRQQNPYGGFSSTQVREPRRRRWGGGGAM